MIIYVDTEYKCHVADDGSMTEVEEEFFDNKCDTFVEGYRRVPAGAEYKGTVATGTMIFPWVDYEVLDAAQRQYERDLYQKILAENMEYESALIEIEDALDATEG